MTVRMKFDGYEGTVKKARYPNGRIALVLYDDEEDEVIVTITTNIVDVPGAPSDAEWHDDMAAIKTYSENRGIIAAMKHTGILKKLVDAVQTEFVTFPIYELDMEIVNSLDEYGG